MNAIDIFGIIGFALFFLIFAVMAIRESEYKQASDDNDKDLLIIEESEMEKQVNDSEEKDNKDEETES